MSVLCTVNINRKTGICAFFRAGGDCKEFDKLKYIPKRNKCGYGGAAGSAQITRWSHREYIGCGRQHMEKPRVTEERNIRRELSRTEQRVAALVTAGKYVNITEQSNATAL